MTLWPRIDEMEAEEIASAPALEPMHLGAPDMAAGPMLAAPDRAAPHADMGPCVPPGLEPLGAAARPRTARHRRAAALAAALAISLAAHAAVFVWLKDWRGREGVNAAADAVTVEIVLEAPPAESEPVAGEEVASVEATPAEIVEAAEVETPVAAAETEPVEAARADAIAPLEVTASEPEPTPPLEISTTEPAPAEQPLVPEAAVPPAPVESTISPASEPETPTAERPQKVAPVTAETPTESATEADVADATDILLLPPADMAPVPSPRPEPRIARRAAGQQSPRVDDRPRRPAGMQHERAQPARHRENRTARAQAAAQPERTTQAAARAAQHPSRAAARGAASAGAEASFSRRLLAHVERHKRYPREAQRKRITGATRLSITIDRNGRLAGARVTRGSGHAILDGEAMAVARRAAPYPRPPEGVGGRTISFAVTLRFSR